MATHINTGNVRFESRMRSRERIERALEATYLEDRGFEVPTMVFTVPELREVAEDVDRLAEGHDGRHYVSLLKQEPSAAAAREMESLAGTGAGVHVAGRAVHLLLGESYLGGAVDNARVEKVLGPATNRSATVIGAIVAKWC